MITQKQPISKRPGQRTQQFTLSVKAHRKYCITTERERAWHCFARLTRTAIESTSMKRAHNFDKRKPTKHLVALIPNKVKSIERIDTFELNQRIVNITRHSVRARTESRRMKNKTSKLHNAEEIYFGQIEFRHGRIVRTLAKPRRLHSIYSRQKSNEKHTTPNAISCNQIGAAQEKHAERLFFTAALDRRFSVTEHKFSRFSSRSQFQITKKLTIPTDQQNKSLTESKVVFMHSQKTTLFPVECERDVCD